MSLRTFIALPLAEEVVADLQRAQRRLAEVGADVRWVTGENLHITLKFLGYTEDVQAPEICDMATEVAEGVEAFEFDVRGLAAVPASGQLRMVWADIVDPTGRLAELNAGLEEAFVAMGFKMENRQFRPHLTLGRIKSGRNVPELRAAVGEFADADFGFTHAEEIVVFSSQLMPEGPIYHPLARVPLG